MSDHDVTHKEIYDRLIAVEGKVDRVEQNTANVVAAFNAAAGAFTVLEWMARAVKPILWLGGLAAAIGVMYQQWRSPH